MPRLVMRSRLLMPTIRHRHGSPEPNPPPRRAQADRQAHRQGRSRRHACRRCRPRFTGPASDAASENTAKRSPEYLADIGRSGAWLRGSPQGAGCHHGRSRTVGRPRPSDDRAGSRYRSEWHFERRTCRAGRYAHPRQANRQRTEAAAGGSKVPNDKTVPAGESGGRHSGRTKVARPRHAVPAKRAQRRWQCVMDRAAARSPRRSHRRRRRRLVPDPAGSGADLRLTSRSTKTTHRAVPRRRDPRRAQPVAASSASLYPATAIRGAERVPTPHCRSAIAVVGCQKQELSGRNKS